MDEIDKIYELIDNVKITNDNRELVEEIRFYEDTYK